MEELERTLKSMLLMARAIAPDIYQGEEFWRSNMDLSGHIFIKLTDSKVFRHETKILPEPERAKLVEGIRRLGNTVANEYLISSNCSNEYELKVLEAIKNTPMHDFEITEALGCNLLISSGIMSALQALLAKDLIYRGDDYKYYARRAGSE